MAKMSDEEDAEMLANAARMSRVLLRAVPHDLIDGVSGKLRCSGQLRRGQGFGWVPCANYAERGSSLCEGPCESTWGPR